MNVSEFHARIGFKPYASVVNSWDAFSETGSALMQLWTASGQRVHDHPLPGAYLRVCCWSSEHHRMHGKRLRTGYNGRAKAIEAVESGKPGYAALANASVEEQGSNASGLWAKRADLTKVYPILQIEHQPGSQDVFALLGTPIPLADIR